MGLFANLKKPLAAYLDKSQIDKIYQAFLFAEDAHSQQKRSSGEPYITHPVAVAMILAEMHLDSETIMAALMHDVMEDTHIEKNVIGEKFGDKVADLVDGVSKLTQIHFENKAEAQAENFRKMVLAMAKDIRVVLVKLADRLHNIRTLAALSPEKKRRIAHETMEIYVPLANRLGMHNFCMELENLCFEATHPHRFVVLKKAVKTAIGNRKAVISTITKALHKRFTDVGLGSALIVGREKHLFSIYHKMQKKNLLFNQIMDVYGFRIIVDDLDECYRALGIVHNLYRPDNDRFKDYIAIPKANGYQSLHTTLFGPYGVPIEIQIRTKQMHDTAEKGIAAHWLYKKNDERIGFTTDQRTQAWLESLLELQQAAATSMEFIENVKSDLFPDEVYVFTPKGTIMELPQGSTVVDFAYAVHTDVGNSCVAAKIDRRYVPLSTVLSNGQTIEIITAPNSTPKSVWLDFVKTAKAKNKVKQFIKRIKQSESVHLGKHLLDNALHSLSTALKNIAAEDIQRVLQDSQMQTKDELFEAIGTGYLIPVLVAQRLVDKSAEQKIIHGNKPVIIKGAEGLLMHFADCCHPIPGDSIIGYFEGHKGITVHVNDCKTMSFADEPDRYITLQWSNELTSLFKAAINCEVYDRIGVLTDITQIFATLKVDVTDVKVLDSGSGSRILRFVIKVHDRNHLAKIILQIRKSPHVVRVSRKRY